MTSLTTLLIVSHKGRWTMEVTIMVHMLSSHVSCRVSSFYVSSFYRRVPQTNHIIILCHTQLERTPPRPGCYIYAQPHWSHHMQFIVAESAHWGMGQISWLSIMSNGNWYPPLQMLLHLYTQACAVWVGIYSTYTCYSWTCSWHVILGRPPVNVKTMQPQLSLLQTCMMCTYSC